MVSFKNMNRLSRKNNISFTKTVKSYGELTEKEKLQRDGVCVKCKRVTVLKRIKKHDVLICRACHDAWYGSESIYDNGKRLKELGWLSDVSKIIP